MGQSDKKFLRLTNFWLLSLFAVLAVCIVPVGIDQYIETIHGGDLIYREPAQVPVRHAAIVLGAAVWEGEPSPILKDRLDSAIQLYKNSKVRKILVSGDHGKAYYDEVNTMAAYLYARGVQKNDIFLDHAGFRTLDSIYRAHLVFQVKDAVIVTQEFHLPRALYLARSRDMNVVGFAANRRLYLDRYYNRSREFFARVKAWLDVNILATQPRFLGPIIPITGSGLRSWDKIKKK